MGQATVGSRSATEPAGADGLVLDISRHCFELAMLLEAMTNDGRWSSAIGPDGARLDHACDWLRLAAETEGVDVNPVRFDDSSLYCSTAWNFESKRGELQAALALGATRFSFAWSAFEILTRCLKLARNGKERVSAPKAAMGFLQRSGAEHRIFQGYADHVHAAILTLKRHPDFDHPNLERELVGHAEATLGLELCRRIRNKLAHGATTLPLPEDWSSGGFTDAEYKTFHHQALRLLLLTIQMVLHYSIGPEHELEDRYRHRLFVIPRLHVLALYEDDEDEEVRNPALQLAL